VTRARALADAVTIVETLGTMARFEWNASGTVETIVQLAGDYADGVQVVEGGEFESYSRMKHAYARVSDARKATAMAEKIRKRLYEETGYETLASFEEVADAAKIYGEGTVGSEFLLALAAEYGQLMTTEAKR
jgi:hypothetical protein